MRLFETLFLLANVPLLVLLSSSPRSWPAWAPLLSTLAVACMGAHLALEGWRWQMIPGYAVTVSVFGFAIANALRSTSVSRAFSVGGGVLLVSAAAAGSVWPVVEFPKPSGAFTIGTVSRRLVDASRREVLSSDRRGPRELMIQVWYPAETASHEERAAYVLDRKQTGSFFDSHRRLVKTYAVLNAEVSKARPSYPVLIYSPSWHGQRNQNTFLVEELASHGFVVVAVDHPYGSAVTVFPDGRVVQAEATDFWDVSSDVALEKSLQRIDQQLQIRVQDVRFVLDELAHNDAPDRDPLLGGRLDLSNAGILGFSFGGTVAAEACRLDRRFRAGVDLDGSLFGESGERGVPTPFFFMNSDLEPPTAAELATGDLPRRRFNQLMARDFQVQRLSMERYGGYAMEILGTNHNNFSDTPLFSPVRSLTGGGAIRPWRAMSIISVYTVGFFQKYLQHSQESWLDAPSPEYPEVRFEARVPQEAAVAR